MTGSASGQQSKPAGATTSEHWEQLLFQSYSRESWRRFGHDDRPLLREPDLEAIQTLNDIVTMTEVNEVYVPLCRLLDLEIQASRRRHAEREGLVLRPGGRQPFIVGIAGSVAVGKSTTARLLQAMLARMRPEEHVELVTTDGFLYPNAELERAGLMHRKGFPESYDLHALVTFLAEVRRGQAPVRIPTYSHLAYDVVPGSYRALEAPDVLILEGLNVLQTPPRAGDGYPPVFVSDFFDLALYVHAEEPHLRQWYVERFLLLRDQVFGDPESYFHRYFELSTEEATEVALDLWTRINAPNLERNIAPTRARADVILNKDLDHQVSQVLLRCA